MMIKSNKKKTEDEIIKKNQFKKLSQIKQIEIKSMGIKYNK